MNPHPASSRPVPGQRSSLDRGVPTDWAPQTEAEAELLRAVGVRDQLAYLEALSQSPLLLPLTSPAGDGVLSDGVLSGQEPVRWATVLVDGTHYVLAFTSRLAMPPGTRAEPVRIAPLFDLAPTLAGFGYGLAVDPGLPIQVFMSPAALADLRAYEPLWSPLESALRMAVHDADAQGYVKALLDGALILPLPEPGDGEAPVAPAPGGDYWSSVGRSDPVLDRFSRDITDPAFPWWRTRRVDGAPVILAFTTPVRMQAEVGERDWVEVPFLAVVNAWPDRECALRLNPGGTNGMELTGEALADMREAYLTAVREQGVEGW